MNTSHECSKGLSLEFQIAYISSKAHGLKTGGNSSREGPTRVGNTSNALHNWIERCNDIGQRM